MALGAAERAVKEAAEVTAVLSRSKPILWARPTSYTGSGPHLVMTARTHRDSMSAPGSVRRSPASPAPSNDQLPGENPARSCRSWILGPIHTSPIYRTRPTLNEESRPGTLSPVVVQGCSRSAEEVVLPGGSRARRAGYEYHSARGRGAVAFGRAVTGRPELAHATPLRGRRPNAAGTIRPLLNLRWFSFDPELA